MEEGNGLAGGAGGLVGSVIGQMRPDAKFPLGQLRREGGSHSKERENRFWRKMTSLFLSLWTEALVGTLMERTRTEFTGLETGGAAKV